MSFWDITQALVCLGALGVGGLMVILYFLQDRLLYFPGMPPDARTVFISPNSVGLARHLEEVFFFTEDNLRLQAYFVRHAQTRLVPTILYFHGNAGNLSYRLPNVRRLLNSVGCNVFIVSYRGYGKSEGTPNEQGLQKDAQAALNFLHSQTDVDPNKIVLFGRSLGGAVAIKLASDNPGKVAGVMVENTFTSIPDMIDVVLPLLGYFKTLATNKWENKVNVKKINVPILFLAGGKDELVPARMMGELYAAANGSEGEDKQLAWFEEGHHMDTFMQQGYYDTVKQFIQKLFSEKKENEDEINEDMDEDNMENINESNL